MAVNNVDQAIFNAVEYNGPRPSLSEFQQLERRSTFDVVVQPGKMKLQILQNDLVSNESDQRYLFIETNLEGVEWWSIDDSSPSVDEDTDAFGWILDTKWPEYIHDHGLPWADPTSGVDHTGTNPGGGGYPAVMKLGVREFYSTLPTFVSASAARLNPFKPVVGNIYQGGYSEALDNVGLVNYNGSSLNLSVDNTSFLLGAARNVQWLWGLDTYKNFGTDNDGLCFFVVFYVEDITALTPNPQKFFCFMYSYPFTEITYRDIANLPDETFVTAGGAVDIWSKEDLMIDFALNTPDGVSCKLDMSGYFGVTNENLYTIKNGYQVFKSSKSDWGKTISDANSIGVSEFPIWNRITAGRVEIASKAGSVVNARLVNIFFGPQPGRRRVLRPFEYTTEQPWSIGSKPAIGLYNPGSTEARVRIIYGAN